MESEFVRVCQVVASACLSDWILGTWHTVGAQSVFAACLGSPRFRRDYRSANTGSGEAAAGDL